MVALKKYVADVVQLFYPHICTGCGSDLLNKSNLLCASCVHELPHTFFANYANNPVEKVFTGRIHLQGAHSEFYFSKGQLVQQLIHQLKYNNNKDIGRYLGSLIGLSLLHSGRFSDVDYLIPLPLYKDKEKIRGFNQAAIICEGIHATMQVPLMLENVIRARATSTQTKKHRSERWQNVDQSFSVLYPQQLIGKHLLLVDDVITTGATLEACGQEILKIPGTRISLAALAHASK